MKNRLSVLLLLLAVCLPAGFAQPVTPSITIGTHVLTLGMPEATVLDQLGNDLTLKHLSPGMQPNPPLPDSSPVSSWLVEKKAGSRFVVVGGVSFKAHQLASASRSWEIDEASSKSLFYAINLASKSLEQEGFRNCQLSTVDHDYSLDNGSLTTKVIDLNCGMKGINITRNLSDAPDVSSNIDVMKWLHGI